MSKQQPIATVQINTEPPILPGQPVPVGKGEGKIDPDKLQLFIDAGHVVMQDVTTKESK